MSPVKIRRSWGRAGPDIGSGPTRERLGGLQARAEVGELAGVDRVGVLGRRVAALADVGREAADATDHLVHEVAVALDEAGARTLADAQQVVEDQHLAVGRRAGPD